MKRVNNAVWIESKQYWMIKVQRDGIRKSFYSGKPGRAGLREANAKADAWLEGQTDPTDRSRVESAWEDYLAYRKTMVSSGSCTRSEYHGRVFILPKIGSKRLAALTEIDLQTIINSAYRSGHLKSKKSLQSLRAELLQFMKYCRKRKICTLNPEDLVIPSSARIGEKRILQPEDLKKLFICDQVKLHGKTKKDEYINAYRFAVLTGLRPGELIGLRWDDIRGNILTVKRAINTRGEVTTGKNHNALRHFELTPLALAVLDEQRGISTTESVFEIDSQSTYRHRWEKFCKHNEITYVSLYEMRHTFVSIVKQLPAEYIKPIVGHSKSMDTFGVYGHTLAGEQERTANEIGRIFDNLLD